MKRFLTILTLCFFTAALFFAPAYAATMADLQGHWSAGDVSKLIERGAIGGYPDGTFRPDTTITRAEFSKILRQSLSLTSTEGNDFTDTASHWAVTDIHTLVSNQIIVPAEYGSQYGPDTAITRREIAIMLIRAMGLNDSAVALSGQATGFSDDASIHSYDKGYLYLAKELGLVGGYEDGSFRPAGKATRAEASVMIVRLLNLKGLDDSSVPAESPDKQTETPSQSAAVSCQLTVSQTERTTRNALGEQYVAATLELAVQNRSDQAVSISSSDLKTIVTYSSGAQVTAMQPEFQQTVAAGQDQVISTTVHILLPDNQVANLVLGSQIQNIAVQLTINGQAYTFPEASAMLQNAVQ